MERNRFLKFCVLEVVVAVGLVALIMMT